MGINRPTNLNIRDTPGNGSIVGPSTTPSCVETTTTCESCFNTCDACSFQAAASLGQTFTVCACPCCDIVCRCDCSVCDRAVPSGMWKTSEQYEAKERDAWGDDSSTTGVETCICNINSGLVDCGCTETGGYVLCAAAGVVWVVAPSSSEVSRNWYSRGDAGTRAQQVSGCSGWFIPSHVQLQNPGHTCRTYWDSYSSNNYWSNTQSSPTFCACLVNISDGTVGNFGKTNPRCVRAFRTVSY